MAQPPIHKGRLTISQDTLTGGSADLKLLLENGNGALGLVEISIAPEVLMRALRSYGAQPCEFRMWPNVAMYPDPENMLGQCKHFIQFYRPVEPPNQP